MRSRDDLLEIIRQSGVELAEAASLIRLQFPGTATLFTAAAQRNAKVLIEEPASTPEPTRTADEKSVHRDTISALDELAVIAAEGREMPTVAECHSAFKKLSRKVSILRTIAATREIVATFGDTDPYLIWSRERGQWWRPAGTGYTPHIREAGRFERKLAMRFCYEGSAGWDGWQLPPDLAILETDAEQIWVKHRASRSLVSSPS